MSSTDSSQTHDESKQEKEPIHVSDSQVPEGEVVVVGEGEEEEVGECPFCLFMKEGGCRDEFVNWEKCVEEAEKNQEDVVEKCAEITFTLKKCMEANRDYYAPLLQAEEEVMKGLERKGKEGEEANSSATNSQGKTVNGST